MLHCVFCIYINFQFVQRLLGFAVDIFPVYSPPFGLGQISNEEVLADRQRLRQVNAFNEDDTPVFLISLKAGGTGLNLTGADVVIHYDPWWNLSAQNQATDRAHRIGQMSSVQVYNLIAKDSIEEKIQKMQQAKAELADSIIREGEGAISSMSKDEIIGLFE